MAPIKIKQKTQQRVFHQIPKYNGYGTDEDSLLNCKILIPLIKDNTQNYAPGRVKNATNVFINDKYLEV